MDKLPNKWAVAYTPENRVELGKIWDKACKSTCYQDFNSGYIHSHNGGDQYILDYTEGKRFWTNYHSRYLKPDYEEISFEDFKRLVLNQTESYEIY